MTTLPHVSLAFAFLMGLHFGLTYFVDEKDRQCPHISHRKFRIQSVCNGSSRVYTCLYNTNNKAYDEFCKNNEKVRAGLKYVISGTFRNVRCSEQRYQPITFSSNQGSDCLYSKSQCNEAGQIVVDNKSSIGDSKCRCDYTRNFAFVSRTRNSCFCTPSEEDCTCYIKHCPKYTALSPDYECLSLYSTNKKFNCKFVTQAHPNGSLTTTLIKGRKTKDRKVTTVSTITGSSSTFIPLFVVLTVLVIVGMGGIIVFRKYSCKRNQANFLKQGRPQFPHQNNLIISDNVVNENHDDSLDNGVSKDNPKDKNKKSNNVSSSKYDARQDAFSSNNGYQNEMQEIAVESAEELPKSIPDCSYRKRNIVPSSYKFEDPNKKTTDDISSKYDSRQDAFSNNNGYQNEMQEIADESAEELPKYIPDCYRKRNMLSSSNELQDPNKKTTDDISSIYDSRQDPFYSNKVCQNKIEEIEVESAEELPKSIPDCSYRKRNIVPSSYTFEDPNKKTTDDISSIYDSRQDPFYSNKVCQNKIEEIEVESAEELPNSIPANFDQNRDIVSSSYDFKDQNSTTTDDTSSFSDSLHDLFSSDNEDQNELDEMTDESPKELLITAYFDQNRDILSFSNYYSSGHHMINGALLYDKNDTLNIHQAENLVGQQRMEEVEELALSDETSIHSTDRYTIQRTDRSSNIVTLVSDDPGIDILPLSNQAETQVKTLDEASIQYDVIDGHIPHLTELQGTPVTQVSNERFDLGRDILSGDYSSEHHMPQPAPQIIINTNTRRIHQMENHERQQQVQYNLEIEQFETLDATSIQYDSTDGYTPYTELQGTPVTQVWDE